MTYVPQDWVDGPGGGTPVSAARLLHMEDGIANAGGGGEETKLGAVATYRGLWYPAGEYDVGDCVKFHDDHSYGLYQALTVIDGDPLSDSPVVDEEAWFHVDTPIMMSGTDLPSAGNVGASGTVEIVPPGGDLPYTMNFNGSLDINLETDFSYEEVLAAFQSWFGEGAVVITGDGSSFIYVIDTEEGLADLDEVALDLPTFTDPEGAAVDFHDGTMGHTPGIPARESSIYLYRTGGVGVSFLKTGDVGTRPAISWTQLLSGLPTAFPFDFDSDENNAKLDIKSVTASAALVTLEAATKAAITVHAELEQGDPLLNLQDSSGNTVFSILPDGSYGVAPPVSFLPIAKITDTTPYGTPGLFATSSTDPEDGGWIAIMLDAEARFLLSTGDDTAGVTIDITASDTAGNLTLFEMGGPTDLISLILSGGTAQIKVTAGIDQSVPLLKLQDEDGLTAVSIDAGGSRGIHVAAPTTLATVDLNALDDYCAVGVVAGVGQTDPVLYLADETNAATTQILQDGAAGFYRATPVVPAARLAIDPATATPEQIYLALVDFGFFVNGA